MATILQIETATEVCSAAISKNGVTIALKEEFNKNIHAQKLTLFINEIMQAENLRYQQLDAVAVSKGPGSYTGLRIGVSTAKGLCFALEKPLISVNTLELMAAGYLQKHPDFEGLLAPMIDARRMEVYTAIYTNKLHLKEAVSAKVIDEKSFIFELSNNYIVFLGNGVAKCQTFIKHPNAHFLIDNFNSAAHMSKLADEAFKQKKIENLAYFEPFYLKDFVATVPKPKI